MTEPRTDNVYLYTSLKKVNRGGVAKNVRRYARVTDGMIIGTFAGMPSGVPLNDFVDAESG